ncbi:chain length determinant protein tyrosine kinase EpsG [Sphingomonas vulcanisoli]|uniref:Chain length determinant protein tyrosine kinase EpsG n=1 Tax=Sphingomonas vulcanisoli TaxID=1658060 RepID=A0ABX0TWA3_9SPHN|nr:polysaccharide biosynthesis tyrosine autokinase [Sphingomonas vulcanisoli]NIJ08065.1 chain length determinant protein tyrosine kinase EpsG [Sphingomonas vulcanisoli]
MTGSSLANSRSSAVPTTQRPRIGELLISQGLLTLEQAGLAAQRSIEQGLRFGEAAVSLGFVAQSDVESALAMQVETLTIAAPATIAPEIFAFHDPESDKAEDMRALRNALTLRWFQHDEGARTLAVISPARGDGRSLVAANLAVSFAQVGVRTLLIDADMRHPRQHLLFGLDNRQGLSGYLNDKSEDAAHYYIPELESLTIIPVGKLPPSPQELLLRPTLASLVEAVSLNFEVVLIDTPAASVGSDYQIVASAARGVLMVGTRLQTRTRAVSHMLDTCQDIGVKTVGGVLVEAASA